MNRSNRQYSDLHHLDETMKWLVRSQDNSIGGCSAAFEFNKGWAPPYPETTGYIISTFIEYYKLTGIEEYLERAIQLGEWEVEIQMNNGAVRGGSGINNYPIVFNTGMVIFGWTDLFNITQRDVFLEAAKNAGDWLIDNQEIDGKWTVYTYNNIPHAYHSRVAWSLLELYKSSGVLRYKQSAVKNIKWVLSLATENGWINKMGFEEIDDQPLTHTIAYTLRGLLESSIILDDDEISDEIFKIVHLAATNLKVYYLNTLNFPKKSKHMLPGRMNDRWQSSCNFSCITGNAQIAIIWLKIYNITNDDSFLSVARELIDEIKKVQRIGYKDLNIKGGIPGSYPIWGGYMPFSFPNWAAKFFADTLLLINDIEIKKSKI